MIAKELITGAVLPLTPSDTGVHALASMDELRVSHLPVVNDTELLGIVSDKALLALQDPGLEVGDRAVPLAQASVEEGEHVFEVFKAFASNDLTLLPVVNARRQYTGSITLPELVRHFSAISAIRDPGSVMVLEIASKDYSISEIARIVESNDAKILGLYISAYPDSTRLEVTLKVNVQDIGNLMQSFNRYNYEIKATWSQQDAYSDGLQDRFDALMNYLSI
jgi:CBS domain-containing protein